MAGAEIGALRISLGLDSAQFSTGLKKAQGGLASFGKTAGVALAAVAVAATAAGVALGMAVKGAIDHADEIGKTAQKVGVTAEALSRLEFAAKLSDVSLEGLAGGLKKLSVNLLGVAQGSGGTAKTAFAALGISVTDATGKLKSSDVVFGEVAERFARMEDGSTKTALAVALFGKAGADLIPLLNEGADGLKRMADESDRTGNTISGTTAKAAEKFNDTLTGLRQTFDGVVNQIMTAVLPALQNIAGTLASPEFAKAATDFASVVVGALDAITQAAIAVIETIGGIGKALDWANSHDMLGNRKATAKPGSDEYKLSYLGIGGRSRVGGKSPKEQLLAGLAGGGSGMGADFFDGIFGAPKGKPPVSPANNPFNPVFDSIDKGSKKAVEAVKPLKAEIIELGDTMSTIGDGISSTFSGIFKAMKNGESAIDALMSGLNRITDQLIDMAMNQLVQNALGSLFGAVGGIGGLKTSPGLGGLTGTAVKLPRFAHGGFGTIGGVGGTDSKLFAAMVTPGEAFAFGDAAERGGAPVITINNYAGADVRTSTRGDGTITIDLLKKAMGQEIATPGSPAFKALRTMHGTSQPLTGRTRS